MGVYQKIYEGPHLTREQIMERVRHGKTISTGMARSYALWKLGHSHVVRLGEQLLVGVDYAMDVDYLVEKGQLVEVEHAGGITVLALPGEPGPGLGTDIG